MDQESIHKSVYTLTFPFERTIPILKPCWSLENVHPDGNRFWRPRGANHDVRESAHCEPESYLIRLWVNTVLAVAGDKAVEGEDKDRSLLVSLFVETMHDRPEI